MRKIPIKTNKEIFYRQFLELLRSISPFNSLRSRELDILGQILYQNNKYKDVSINTRHLIIFSTEVRKEMRDNVGVSEEIFNNNLSGLRKSKLLDSSNRLHRSLSGLFFNKEFTLQFNFKEWK
jgi:hypothetical protein